MKKKHELIMLPTDNVKEDNALTSSKNEIEEFNNWIKENL